MRIAIVGRFSPEWATERDIAEGLRRAGHDAYEVRTMGASATGPCDLVVWMPFDLGQPRPDTDAPIVGYHLDRFWGLKREAALRGSAWARDCALLVTADGGHQAAWEALGVRHRWLPPAITAAEASLEPAGRGPWPEVLFVGSWRTYHPEWPHRTELVAKLRSWYGARFKAAPEPGRLLRGQGLTDLVAGAAVVVGDACLAGNAGRYWSNRVPETLGRGGFLVHPEVDGLDEWFRPGEHLATWPAGDWRALRDRVDSWLEAPTERAEIAAAGRAEVLARHTFDARAAELLDLCAQEGLL